MLTILLAASVAASSCANEKHCNDQGTAAYKAGKYAAAIDSFSRQIDFAEATEPGTVDDITAHNNAALARWKNRQCLLALQHLRVARSSDVANKSTRFNQDVIGKACEAAVAEQSIAGEYWQYAGANQWNKITVTPIMSGSYQIDASALHVTRAPLVKNPGAINVGALRSIGKFGAGATTPPGVSNSVFFGNYATESAKDCLLQIVNHGQGEIEPIVPSGEKRPECAIGGLNVSLGGTYYQVSKGKQGLLKPLSPPSNATFPAATKLVLPKFAKFAAHYSELTQGKTGWSTLQPCDSDVGSISVDAVNQVIWLNLGQEAMQLALNGVSTFGGNGFKSAYQVVDSDNSGTLVWTDLGAGQIEVELADMQVTKRRYVAAGSLGNFPIRKEANCTN